MFSLCLLYILKWVARMRPFSSAPRICRALGLPRSVAVAVATAVVTATSSRRRRQGDGLATDVQLKTLVHDVASQYRQAHENSSGPSVLSIKTRGWLRWTTLSPSIYSIHFGFTYVLKPGDEVACFIKTSDFYDCPIL